MFNPYDADNHAGMLSSMKPDPLLGLSGPARGEPSNTVEPAKNPAVLKLLEDAAAALVLHRKAILIDAAAKAYESEAKAKAAQVKAFEVEVGHFKAQYWAASTAMADGLDKTANAVLISLKSMLMETNRATSQIESGKWTLAGVPPVSMPWIMRNAIYGYDAVWNGGYGVGALAIVPFGTVSGVGAKQSKGIATGTTPQDLKFDHKKSYKQIADVLRSILPASSIYKNEKNDTKVLGALGLFADQTLYPKLSTLYKDGRAALKDLSPEVATVPPSSLGLGTKGGKGDSWVQVEDGVAYVVHRDGWRFATRNPKENTKLRYFGKWSEQNPQYGGGVAQKYWNELVIPPAMNQQATYLKLVDAQQNLQKAELGLRFAEQNAKAKAAEFTSVEGQYQQAMQALEVLKAKLPKNAQAYATKAVTALQAAVELDAFTEAREMLLKKNSELASQYNQLIAQAETLITEAGSESDPLKKQRKQAEAQRRLTRAKEFADRGQGLRNRSGEFSKRRTTAAPVARGAAGLVPSRVVLPAEVGAAVSGAKTNADKIDDLSKVQTDQQKAGDQAQSKMVDLADQLPEGYKPPNIPPPEKKKEGGGFGLIVAGLVAYAALRK